MLGLSTELVGTIAATAIVVVFGIVVTTIAYRISR
jgi:hypothetical protein